LSRSRACAVRADMTSKIYGIIGHPVKHSLSPAMQNAAFRASGIDAEYRTFDVAPHELEDFLGSLDKEQISGINVTIPHKIGAKDYIARHGVLDENAKRLGAVNTIKVTGSKPEGFNTDGPGFYRSLVEELKFEPEGKTILILGAGGAATAVTMYLGNGPKEIFIYDVDGKRCEDLKAHYSGYYGVERLHIVKGSLERAIEGADLLINATPVGMKEGDPSPVDKDLLHTGLYVYDLVYNRKTTALVAEATKAKLHALTGTGMLLYQGAIAFEIWTGKKAPVGVMRRALREELSKQS